MTLTLIGCKIQVHNSIVRFVILTVYTLKNFINKLKQQEREIFFLQKKVLLLGCFISVEKACAAKPSVFICEYFFLLLMKTCPTVVTSAGTLEQKKKPTTNKLSHQNRTKCTILFHKGQRFVICGN